MITIGDLVKSALPNGTSYFTQTKSDETPRKSGKQNFNKKKYRRYLDYVKHEVNAGLKEDGEADVSQLLDRVRWNSCPQMYWCTPHDPMEVFAIFALLLKRSGAYNYITSEAHAAPGHPAKRRVLIRDEDRDRWNELGRLWAAGAGKSSLAPIRPPSQIMLCWTSVIVHNWTKPIFDDRPYHKSAPSWWEMALIGMSIADEAAVGVGHNIDAIGARTSGLSTNRYPRTWVNTMVEDTLIRDAALDDETYTIAECVSPDLACVLPKSRTSQVGCTLRTLSHNLALLPPRGEVRGSWILGDCSPNHHASDASLNVLLIPYPYQVEASCFKTRAWSAVKEESRLTESWGWFSVEPPPHTDIDAFFDDEFFPYINSLMEKSARDFGMVNAIVFPELALSEEVYKRLVDRITEKYNKVDLLVAGVSSHDGVKGNYAAMTAFYPSEQDGSNRYKWKTEVHSKHHRWCVEKEQIRNYGLGAYMDPNFRWWEDQEIRSRKLPIFSFRGGTTATVLICEDLARTDPAQEIVRAIGPQIIFALLMDGPQLKERWPARYATVLAEDPGSSVLTFTSLGLINRSNRSKRYPPTRCIALWREPMGDTIELNLAEDSSALLLALSPRPATEFTLDGRRDGNAHQWGLSAVQSISPNPSIPKPNWHV